MGTSAMPVAYGVAHALGVGAQAMPVLGAASKALRGVRQIRDQAHNINVRRAIVG